jgi:hypothetical protein
LLLIRAHHGCLEATAEKLQYGSAILPEARLFADYTGSFPVQGCCYQWALLFRFIDGN